MRRRQLVLLGLSLSACADKALDGPPEAGVEDARAVTDATVVPDGGARDAWTPDQGFVDVGPTDTGLSDVGSATTACSYPRCASIQGTPGITVTCDEGATLMPNPAPLPRVHYTQGIVPLDAVGAMLAVSGPEILRSEDGGCSWRRIAGTPTGFPHRLVRAGPHRAYGWATNRDGLFRVDTSTVTWLSPPTEKVFGVGVDARDPEHLRFVGAEGQIFDSRDAGGAFVATGSVAVSGRNPYVAIFDPADLDRAWVGTSRRGVLFTDDGGETWTTSTGLATGSRGVNVFSLAASPADSRVVWAQGIDLELGSSAGRHIWRSDDGGRSFRIIVTRNADVTLINGNLLVPHPVDPAILYFVFSSTYADHGTDLFRHDARRDRLTRTHNHYGDTRAIAFSPVDPGVMYLGVGQEIPD